MLGTCFIFLWNYTFVMTDLVFQLICNGLFRHGLEQPYQSLEYPKNTTFDTMFLSTNVWLLGSQTYVIDKFTLKVTYVLLTITFFFSTSAWNR